MEKKKTGQLCFRVHVESGVIWSKGLKTLKIGRKFMMDKKTKIKFKYKR